MKCDIIINLQNIQQYGGLQNTWRQYKSVLQSIANFQHYHEEFIQFVSEFIQGNLQLMKFDGEISMILWCFASLNYRDENLIAKLCNKLIQQEKNGNIFCYDVCTTLWSLATLDCKLDDVIDFLMLQSLDLIDQFQIQELSNIVWACAYFQKWEDKNWWEKMLQKLDNYSKSYSDEDVQKERMAQIYHSYMMSISDEAKQISNLFPKFVLQIGESAWVKSQHNLEDAQKISMFQQSVFDVLEEMEMEPKMQSEIISGLIRADIIVKFLDCEFAVEVDGPWHFSKNKPHFPLGQTKLRNRLLRNLGFIVLNVPFYEWPQNRVEDQTQYLMQKMSDCKASTVVDY
eukprot:TRINITY_DN7527_c0_g1_i1.p2 TRINITY_DN7527_c0_g1~~TRINITY_DN7527_c0_g1_i1.p2  ORF type:complete len:343 (-),score=54.62 TRINITY_DN7527_c0_g1_i1:23-1051(-)